MQFKEWKWRFSIIDPPDDLENKEEVVNWIKNKKIPLARKIDWIRMHVEWFDNCDPLFVLQIVFLLVPSILKNESHSALTYKSKYKNWSLPYLFDILGESINKALLLSPDLDKKIVYRLLKSCKWHPSTAEVYKKYVLNHYKSDKKLLTLTPNDISVSYLWKYVDDEWKIVIKRSPEFAMDSSIKWESPHLDWIDLEIFKTAYLSSNKMRKSRLSISKYLDPPILYEVILRSNEICDFLVKNRILVSLPFFQVKPELFIQYLNGLNWKNISNEIAKNFTSIRLAGSLRFLRQSNPDLVVLSDCINSSKIEPDVAFTILKLLTCTIVDNNIEDPYQYIMELYTLGYIEIEQDKNHYSLMLDCIDVSTLIPKNIKDQLILLHKLS